MYISLPWSECDLFVYPIVKLLNMYWFNYSMTMFLLYISGANYSLSILLWYMRWDYIPYHLWVSGNLPFIKKQHLFMYSYGSICTKRVYHHHWAFCIPGTCQKKHTDTFLPLESYSKQSFRIHLRHNFLHSPWDVKLHSVYIIWHGMVPVTNKDQLRFWQGSVITYIIFCGM